MTDTATALDERIQAFLDHLASRRSTHTVRSYGSDLAQLSTFLGGQFDLSPSKLRLYLRKYGGTPVTRARKLSTLRTFTKYLKQAGHITTDPTESLEAPIRRKRLPKALSQARYNEEHGVEPTTVNKVVRETVRAYNAVADVVAQYDDQTVAKLKDGSSPMRLEDLPILIASLEKEMKDLAKAMEFEKAAHVRDEIQSLRQIMGTADGRLGMGKRKLKRATVGR